MKKIVISSTPWQTRGAVLHNNRLQNIYFAAPHVEQLERAFYRGVVTKILPGIQTAFVNIGQEKAGFLHISEIDRELALARMQDSEVSDEFDEEKKEEQRPSQRQALDISKILHENEPVLVQVSKEPVYEKGAKLTTCFTLPGRFLVLLPNIPRIGISKKIDDREERQRLKNIVLSNLPEGMGAIIRTSTQNHTEKEIKRDLDYLMKTWRTILDKFAKATAQEKIHEDLPLELAIVRDHLDEDVDEVITNTKESQNNIYQFLKTIAPEYTHKVKLFNEPPLIFTHFGIERQIEAALQKKAELKSGGSIIIESTEAMTVIDVNTGKYTGRANMEETILQTNLEAAEEIVRQLRLRNIGGLIVIDFIDMSTAANRQRLYRHLEQTLREYDKFQSVVLRVSEFGLVQMTRKRAGKTLVQQLTQICTLCHGTGFIKSIATISSEILYKLKSMLLEKERGMNVSLLASTQIFTYLTETQYNSILELEKTFGCTIILENSEHIERDAHHIKFSTTKT